MNFPEPNMDPPEPTDRQGSAHEQACDEWHDMAPAMRCDWIDDEDHTSRVIADVLRLARDDRVRSDAHEVLAATFGRYCATLETWNECSLVYRWRESVAKETPEHLPLLDRYIKAACDVGGGSRMRSLTDEWIDTRIDEIMDEPEGEDE